MKYMKIQMKYKCVHLIIAIMLAEGKQRAIQDPAQHVHTIKIKHTFQ